MLCVQVNSTVPSFEDEFHLQSSSSLPISMFFSDPWETLLTHIYFSSMVGTFHLTSIIFILS